MANSVSALKELVPGPVQPIDGWGHRSIASTMDTCPSPFHRRVRTVPVCSVGDNLKAPMKSYGLAALQPLATTHSSPPLGGIGDLGAPGRGTKTIATANLQIELPELDPVPVSSGSRPSWSSS